MSYSLQEPDAEVLFELTASTFEGRPKQILSGYRPVYGIRPDYWTSTHHEFLESGGLVTGQAGRANVWFVTPEAYPNSLWVGRVLQVAEGSRVVGSARIVKVFNAALVQNGG